MAISYASLTTFALCDEATRKITFRLKGLTARDAALDYADERVTMSQSEIAAQLFKVNGNIAETTFKLTQPGLDPEAAAVLNDDLDSLQIQKRRLQRRANQVAGLGDFLTDVDAEEVDVRAAKLQEVLTGIAAQRATLSA